MPSETQSRLPRSKSVQSLRQHVPQPKDLKPPPVSRSSTAQGSLRAVPAAAGTSANASAAVSANASTSTSAIARPAPRLPPSPTGKAFKTTAPLLPPSPTTKAFRPPPLALSSKETTALPGKITTRPRPLHKVTSLPRLTGMGRMGSKDTEAKDAAKGQAPKSKDKRKSDAGKENSAVAKKPPVPPMPPLPPIMPRADSPEKALRGVTKPRLSEEARGLFAPQRKTATATTSMVAPSLFSGSSIRIPRPRIKLGPSSALHSPSMPSPSPSPSKSSQSLSPPPPRSVSTASSRTASAASASTPFLAQIATTPGKLASPFPPSPLPPVTPGLLRSQPPAETPTISALLEREHAADLSLIDEGDVSLASIASFEGLTPPQRAQRPSPRVSKLSEVQDQVARLEDEKRELERRVASMLAEEARLLGVVEQANFERDEARNLVETRNAEKNAAMWESVLKAADEAIDEERNLLATIGCLREMVTAL
ncbi:uncharacterized protein LOC62_04G005592 [Vanrija pseudolonga]|uniref:Uncharacterized protein n=1 Tax=Vanrija pseudolonga TaxID=143232 RepID=A0AAF0Y8P1_9TREE|nr:hypothetical protein LOC62_04G005592 [Vanrija pseudolonga]